MRFDFERVFMSETTAGLLKAAANFTFDNIKDDLFVKVVNKDSELVDRCPHRQVADLYLIPYLLISDDDSGTAYAAVSHKLKNYLEVSDSKLMDQAMLSGMKLFPEMIETMQNMFLMLGDDRPEDPTSKMIVVTNGSQLNGASALFYPGVMEKISLMIGGSYYAIPSSIHEFIIVEPDKGKPGFAEWLSGVIKDVNKSVVSDDDVLSDHPYFYNHRKKVFESC